MIRRASLPLIVGVLLTACGGQPGDARPRQELALGAFQPNPAAPPQSVLDVAGWSAAGEPAAAALYVAVGAAGVDVQRADGRHLQRLGRSPVMRVALVEGVTVDDRPVTLLAGADTDTGAVRWFAVDDMSGALQRMPEASTLVEGGINGLCAQRDPVTGASYLVATTRDGHLERWRVTARSERIAGKPQRVTTYLERRAPLEAPAGDCAANPATGGLLALGGAGELLRVVLPADPDAPATVEALAGADATGLRDIALAEREDGGTVILAIDASGRQLRVLSTAGRGLATLALPQAASAVAASRAALAIVTAGGDSMQFAPWGEVEARLPAPGATP
jgi:hypothetical protein